MKNKKTVPTIRFKGFTEEWENSRLDEVIDLKSGKDYKHLSDGNIPVYGTGGYMLSVNDALSHKDDAIGIGRKGTIDKPYILKAPFWTVDTLFYSLPKKKCDINFLFAIFQKVDWKSKDESTGVPSLSKVAINSINIYSPKGDIDEQELIGRYFQNIDKLIGASEEKVAKLKTIKKACLEKMLLRHGSTIPELRFKGFSEDWVPENLRELSEPLEYGLNAPSTVYDGINKYIRITDIEDDSRLLNNNGLTSPNVDLSLSTRYQLQFGDILFARTGASVGKSYLYKNTDGLVYYAGFLIRARIKSNIDPEFVFQNTLTSEYNKFVKITSQRSGQPGINAQEYSSWSLMLPKSADEQQTIGRYFKEIDKLILKTKQKIEKLKKIKKACLDKMFV